MAGPGRCREVCSVAGASRAPGPWLYANGGKWCSRCQAAWKRPDGLHCPCCGTRLRVGPRRSRYRELLAMTLAERAGGGD